VVSVLQNLVLRVDDIAEDQIVFYDIEATSQFAAYAELKMIGVQYGIQGTPQLVENYRDKRRFREALANPKIIKVAFNNINYDDLVLYRHHYPVNESNRHDLFLAAKTVAPRLPSYSLKFINWWYFGDVHIPEMLLHAWLKKNQIESMWQAPRDLLGPYCLYDVTQTVNLFCLLWEIVQRPEHWEVYTTLELPMGMVMEEIMLRGGEYLSETLINEKVATLQNEKDWWEDDVYKRTAGKISNPNSVKQVGAYLQDEEGIELELTDKGNFSLKKADVLEFLDLDNPDRDRSKIIRGLFEVRRINNTLSYYRNYLAALGDNPEHRRKGWIPKQYSLSGARTRRILSNSKYKLNFQNPNEAAKEVQVVPDGWLGWWIDATQVENVVHIYESGDSDRRESYEADAEWNEYVWLANVTLGTAYSKKELDDRERFPFPSAPHWSMYKGFKTVKLAGNFGMGATKYSKIRRIPESAGRQSFALLHRACPAIKQLQGRVAQDLIKDGFVTDAFGHIYSGDPKKAYKIVAYLIQGCGTGSLPKAQMKANYDTIHQWDAPYHQLLKYAQPYVLDVERKIVSFGLLSGTTHDEIQGRLSLGVGSKQIIATLQQMMFNMTERFSHKFDNIPLRAKLYLSRTTTSEREEVDVKDIKTIRKFIHA
jgi:hypothetical protein